MTEAPEVVIPRSEYTRRIGQVQQLLRDRDLDAAIITRPANIFYLSNFRATSIAAWTARFHALVVPVDGMPRLLARSLEVDAAAEQWTEQPLLWADHEDPYRLVAEVIPGAGRIGVEMASLAVRQFEELQNVLLATFADVSGAIERIAAELSESEVACMRRAAAVTAAGMRTALDRIEVGRFPFEVVGAVHETMYSAGQSDFEKSFVAVWSGPRGGMMHDTRTTQQFQSGDIATIEIMGVDQHYTACSQTCVVLGDQQPPPEVLAAYEMVVAMHDAARRRIRAGAKSHEIYDAANAIYRERVGQDYFRRVGGSIGLSLFALDLVKDSDTVLPEGIPLLVQTLVTEPVLLTCATTVLVTGNGYEELTPRITWNGLGDSVHPTWPAVRD